MKKITFYSPEFKTSENLAVCQSGWKDCPAAYTSGPAVKDCYVIHYIVRGKGRYKTGGRNYPLKKGDGFLICPNVSVSYTSDAEDPWEYYWVGFDGVEVRKLLKLCGLDEEHPVFSYAADDKLLACLKTLSEYNMPGESQDYAMLGSLYIFFSLLMKNQKLGGLAPTYEMYAGQAVKYIREHCQGALSVSRIAAHVGIDRSHLYRVFRSVMNCSVQDYILNYRVQKAQHLLSFTGFQLGEIAGFCGFSDQSHFSTAFKRVTGTTPLQYRRQRREAGEDEMRDEAGRAPPQA